MDVSENAQKKAAGMPTFILQRMIEIVSFYEAGKKKKKEIVNCQGPEINMYWGRIRVHKLVSEFVRLCGWQSEQKLNRWIRVL